MHITEAIAELMENRGLEQPQMIDVMRQIMTGEATDAQIAGFLVALRIKGESVAEIQGAVTVMRELMNRVELDLDAAPTVDIVGTGGDGASIFNVSTASSFVVAAAGARVAKHGNRSVSSKSGAADLLEAAGVNLALSSEQVAACIEEVGVGFMFALNHHSAMKHAIGPRKELAARTVFNVLGPLTNPAGVKRQLLGVFAPHWLRPLAEVLKGLGSEHVLVVNAEDGLDEISIAAPTSVVELKNGELTEYTVTPEDFGLQRADLADLKVADAEASLALIRSLLGGEPSAAADMVALNAGAALYAAGAEASLAEGVSRAQAVLASGAGLAKLEALAAFSQGLSND